MANNSFLTLRQLHISTHNEQTQPSDVRSVQDELNDVKRQLALATMAYDSLMGDYQNLVDQVTGGRIRASSEDKAWADFAPRVQY